MVGVPRYSQHKHTGRLRPHHETSYGWLLGVMIIIGLLLAGVSWSVAEGAATTGGGSVGVHAVVPAPKPTVAPVITAPSNGQTLTTNPVTVAGTCPSQTLIKIFSNGILVGSTVCDSGHFTLQIDLIIGANSLTAAAFNVNDESGPTSAAVNVTLNVPPGGLGFSSELIIQTTTYYKGGAPGDEMVWPFELVGGQAPYAVNLAWGDGKSDLLSRPTTGPFTLKHTYDKPGNGYLNSYPLIVRATDAAGHTAYLQVTSIINDPAGATAAKSQPAAKAIIVAWPFWVLSMLVVLAFFGGEKVEKRKLQRQIEALS